MFKTIRWKLTLWYAGLLAIILILLGVTLYQAFRHSLMAEAIDTVVTRAQQISSFIETPEGGAAGEGTFIDITDPDLVKKFSSEGIYIEIRDGEGRLVNRSFLLGGYHLNGGTLVARLKTAGPGTLELRRLPEVGRMVIYTLHLRRGGQDIGRVQVGRSLRFMDRALDRLQILLLFIAGGGFLLAVGVGIILARAALAPIDRITRAARQIGAGDLHQRLNLRGPDDEVTRLAKAFDEMLDRLERSFQRERRFTADVSHELRTPLTIIKGTAEVALRGGAKGPGEYREALQSIQSEADRMTKITRSLLTLARADAGQQRLEVGKVDLAGLVKEAQEKFAPLAERKGSTLEAKIALHLEIEGDEERLKQLLSNLVENALKYTQSGDRIELALEREGPWAKLTVADTGIGIPEEDLPHIFERFYRVDRARSREEGGAGLGLAIAKWIVEAHGGRIEVQSQPGQETIFTVRLPLPV
ncbi:MAG: sensor histidine kinase [Candidatus Bipolaricaulia bacterium]